MDFDTISKYLARTLFLFAAAAIAFAFLEWIAEFFDYSLTEAYSAGRVLELAATLLVFVIAVLLRQIRNELRAKQRQ